MHGDLLILGSQLAWAVGALFLKKLTGTVNPALAMALVAIIGGITLIPVLFIFHRDLYTLTREDVFWAAIRGVIGVTIAGLLFTYGISRTSLSHAAVLALAYPLFTVLLGVLFLGEAITWQFIVASILFIIGYIILTL